LLKIYSPESPSKNSYWGRIQRTWKFHGSGYLSECLGRINQDPQSVLSSFPGVTFPLDLALEGENAFGFLAADDFPQRKVDEFFLSFFLNTLLRQLYRLCDRGLCVKKTEPTNILCADDLPQQRLRILVED